MVDVAKHIKPSARGELEITTVNQEFLKDGELKVQVFRRGFAWLDTGTHDSLDEASTFVEVFEKRQGLKVACLEGIAYRNGWISEEKMRELAKHMLNNQYGQYLLKVIDEMKEEINSNTFTHPEMSENKKIKICQRNRLLLPRRCCPTSTSLMKCLRKSGQASG